MSVDARGVFIFLFVSALRFGRSEMFHLIRDTSVKDVVTFSTTFHPGFFDDLALLFVL